LLPFVRKLPPFEGLPELIWAIASVDLIYDLASRDPEAARALLDAMRAVAEKRGEAALWEPWAKAATNLMNDLPSRDLDAARALHGEMRAVAEKRGEAALWQPWAHDPGGALALARRYARGGG
jgi:hypothetical protein